MNKNQSRLIEFLQSRNHVEELTCNFYLDPARFAPESAREAILAFFREGNCVLDTLTGEGTTIVEVSSPLASISTWDCD